jgi:hypothetical protein
MEKNFERQVVLADNRRQAFANSGDRRRNVTQFALLCHMGEST